jgi:hypothetical protein
MCHRKVTQSGLSAIFLELKNQLVGLGKTVFLAGVFFDVEGILLQTLDLSLQDLVVPLGTLDLCQQGLAVLLEIKVLKESLFSGHEGESKIENQNQDNSQENDRVPPALKAHLSPETSGRSLSFLDAVHVLQISPDLYPSLML